MANAKLAILGDKELQRILKTLPASVATKGNRAAVTAAGAPIRKAARAKAPRQSGLLKKAIRQKVKTYRGSGIAVAIIGAQKDVKGEYRGKSRIPFYYLHLVSGGTRHSKANPFLAEAYRANKAASVAAAGAKLKQVIEREVARLGRK